MSEPGRVARWRMAEPVRFYGWPVLLVLVAVFAWQASSGEWPTAVVLGLVVPALYAALEAARMSVYSEPANLRCVVDAARKAARGELIP